MNKFTNPLQNIKIASPCSADWNEMIGNEQKRFCGSCQKNVYNLSGMSKDEAEKLLIDSEGRLCVRFYKRADGTILTQDCPVGWAAFKRRVSKTAAAFASLIFGVIGGLGFNSLFKQQENKEPHIMGAIAYQPTPKKKSSKPTPQPTFNEPLMGEMSAPSPTPKAKPKKKDLQVTIKKILNSPEKQS